MFNVIFAVQSRDIGATKRAAAFMTEEVQASEVINFTQGVLTTTLLRFDWEEFGRHDLPAVLHEERTYRISFFSSFIKMKIEKKKKKKPCTYLTSETLEMEGSA